MGPCESRVRRYLEPWAGSGGQARALDVAARVSCSARYALSGGRNGNDHDHDGQIIRNLGQGTPTTDYSGRRG